MKNNIKGITLISLVITIVILIILAGIAINLSIGNNGIFSKAKLAKEKTINAQDEEERTLSNYKNEMEEYIDGTRSENNTNSGEWILLKTVTSTDETIEYTLDNNDKFSNYKSVAIMITDGVGDTNFINPAIIGVNMYKSCSSIQSYAEDGIRGISRYVSDNTFNLWTASESFQIYLYGIK